MVSLPGLCLAIFAVLSTEIYIVRATFDHCIVPPLKCPNINVTFFLYTRNTQKQPYQLDMSNKRTIDKAPFIRDEPIVLIIHGYQGSKDLDPNKDLRPAYFKRGEINIISVDYSPLVKEYCYIMATQNLPLVAKCTADLIDYIVNYHFFALEDFHIIGFSLGAQAASRIQANLKSGNITRLTGLDPAMPLFVTVSDDSKLTSDDALFVDVMHTNGLSKGKYEACGDVDFYVNGGLQQPGCDKQNLTSTDSCNHARAPAYFAESINTQAGFVATHCASWILYVTGYCNANDRVLMGEYTPNTARGIYYVNTNYASPYAKGSSTEATLKMSDNEISYID